MTVHSSKEAGQQLVLVTCDAFRVFLLIGDASLWT